MKLLMVFGIFLCCCGQVIAQDTLPSFKVALAGKNRVIVSWFNNYPVVNQINIQRSTDSLRNFSTILTVPDPSLVQNGIVDPAAPNNPAFYRLFILFDNGKYVITPSKRASAATNELALDYGIAEGQNQRIQTEELSNSEKSALSQKLQSTTNNNKAKQFIVVKNSMSFQVKDADFKRFRDSILYKTKDTLDYISIDSIRIKPFATAPAYVRSKHVYTEREGNVILNIPNAQRKLVKIRILFDDKRHFFTIDPVSETYLEIDKAIFLTSGWYRFEMYEDNKLVEENRFFIAKDF